jgi:hypothetical protein
MIVSFSFDFLVTLSRLLTMNQWSCVAALLSLTVLATPLDCTVVAFNASAPPVPTRVDSARGTPSEDWPRITQPLQEIGAAQSFGSRAGDRVSLGRRRSRLGTPLQAVPGPFVVPITATSASAVEEGSPWGGSDPVARPLLDREAI